MLALKPLILYQGFFTPVSYNGTKAPNGDPLVARDIDVARKTVGGVTYLIAVNGLNVAYTNGVSANVNITGLTGFASAERMFESGTVTISGGTLTDSFKRHGVHVYKLHTER